jgi:chromosome segregation ATPase
MSDLSEIVDSLENRISKLLHTHEKLKQTNQVLEEELKNLKSEQDQFQRDIEQWRDTCSSLKLANSMLGSDQYKRDTKLKINALVREIDQCIVQLSE